MTIAFVSGTGKKLVNSAANPAVVTGLTASVAGECVVCEWTSNGATVNITSATSNVGGTWAIVQGALSAGNNRSGFAICLNAPAGITQVSLTGSAGSPFITACINRFSYTNAPLTLDVGSTPAGGFIGNVAGAVSTTVPINSGNLTLSTATGGLLLFSYGSDDSAVGTVTIGGSGTYISSFNEGDTTVNHAGAGGYQIVSSAGPFNVTGLYNQENARGAIILAALIESSAATDQPPSQICFPDDVSPYEASDCYDQAPFDFYTDTVANRDEVQPPIPVELPQSYEWEDVNNADDALWQWPLSQAPPIADVVGPVDMPFTEDSDAQIDDQDELEGFSVDPLPDDIVDQLFNNFDGYCGEDDELEGFSDTPQDTGAAPVDMPFTEDSDAQIEDEEEAFGFSIDPIPEDSPMLAVSEDSDAQFEEDEFAEGFADQPLSDDAAVDQIVVEDGTYQPPDPEDEDFATFDQPLPDDVFDLNIVWPETGDNQIDTPDDEDFSFSIDPIPDDVIPAGPVILPDGLPRRKKRFRIRIEEKLYIATEAQIELLAREMGEKATRAETPNIKTADKKLRALVTSAYSAGYNKSAIKPEPPVIAVDDDDDEEAILLLLG